MTALVVVVIDECPDLAFDLALDLRIERRARNVTYLLILQPIIRIASDVT
jgi:hypothetical protein